MSAGCNRKSYTQEIDVKKALKEYEVEPRSSVFSNLKGAASFMERYRLSSDEVEMIGNWNSYSLGQKITREGIGTSICFLPNRVFLARNNKAYYDKDGNFLANDVYYKIGYWKIENGELLIRFIRMYKRAYHQPVEAFNKDMELETPYYPVWKPILYDEAAVQKTIFYYNRIPKRIKDIYMIDGKDYIRGRNIITLSFNADDSNLYAESRPWFNFLMNPDLDDEVYMYNLIIMYVTGDTEWPKYDFEENRYNLDFSKWK
jgi:hypothetical protein